VFVHNECMPSRIYNTPLCFFQLCGPSIINWNFEIPGIITAVRRDSLLLAHCCQSLPVGPVMGH